MKKSLYLSIALLCYFSLSSYAQNDTIWFDSNWVTTNKNNAAFFRTESAKKGKGYWFEDYYISGVKQMEGLSLKKDTEVYDGTIRWYYENGKPFQMVNYNDGVLNGKRQIFFENGKLKSESFYKDGKFEGKYKLYYDNGKLNEEGDYKNNLKTGFWKIYYPNGKMEMEGTYKDGRKINTWKTFYYDGSSQN
jgi:antitoxin component YwqK of YwqJK toxin-antitoxin module